MGLNFVKSKGYKNFMSKLYGWGAAVVILGALFKINHYPGANTMLIIGLGTEALIFFFSAFEPPHVEPDWSLVYPELAGMYSEGDISQKPSLKNKDLTKELDKMLSDAKIGPELIQSLSKGLHSMSENATKIADISSAADATSDYTKNMKTASQSVGELSNAYKKTSDAMTQDVQVAAEYSASLKNASASVNNLTNTYNSASEAMKTDLNVTKGLMSNFVAASDSAKVLTDQYTKSAEILAKSAASIDFTALESGAYGKELNRISTNLNALNAIYELQLKASNQQVETANQLQAKFDSFIKNINESIDKTAMYKDGVDLLAQNVAALNKVYGNMLTAMNVNVAK